MTLIELLVVVAILAALAGLGWSAYSGVYVEQQASLARTQLQQLAQAFQRFKADTGYWPGQGPFALAAASNVETPIASRVVQCSDTSAGLWLRSTLPTIAVPVGVSDVEAWRAAWFAHPANLWSLMQRPLLCANHPLGRLQDWNAEYARGWRGPYLRADQLGWVDVSVALAADGSGDASSGTLQADLRALPAGREWPPVSSGEAPCPGLASPCAYRWRSLPSTDAGFDALRHTFGAHARPLLYFAAGRPRLAWGGPDGRFGGLHPASSSQACAPLTSAPGGADDLVVCLD